MFSKHIVDWLSPLLGLIGSLMLAIPYFIDFFARRTRKSKIAQIDSGAFGQDDAARLREGVAKVRTEEILGPDQLMALVAGIGCLLLVASFLLLLIAAPE